MVSEDRSEKEVNQAPDPDQKVAQSLDYRRCATGLHHIYYSLTFYIILNQSNTNAIN